MMMHDYDDAEGLRLLNYMMYVSRTYCRLRRDGFTTQTLRGLSDLAKRAYEQMWKTFPEESNEWLKAGKERLLASAPPLSGAEKDDRWLRCRHFHVAVMAASCTSLVPVRVAYHEFRELPALFDLQALVFQYLWAVEGAFPEEVRHWRPSAAWFTYFSRSQASELPGGESMGTRIDHEVVRGTSISRPFVSTTALDDLIELMEAFGSGFRSGPKGITREGLRRFKKDAARIHSYLWEIFPEECGGWERDRQIRAVVAGSNRVLGNNNSRWVRERWFHLLNMREWATEFALLRAGSNDLGGFPEPYDLGAFIGRFLGAIEGAFPEELPSWSIRTPNSHSLKSQVTGGLADYWPPT